MLRRRVAAVAVVLALVGSASSAVAASAAAAAGDSTSTSTTTSSSTTDGPTTSTRPATPSTSIIQRAGGGGPPIDLPVAPVVLRDEPRSAARLASLGVDGSDYASAVDSYGRAVDAYTAAAGAVPLAQSHIDAAIDRQAAASRDAADRSAEIEGLRAAQARVAGELTSAVRRRDKTDRQADKMRTEMRDLAVNEYVAGGFGGPPELLFDFENLNRHGSRTVLLSSVKRDRMAELATVTAYADQQHALVRDLQDDVDDLGRRITDAQHARDRATAEHDAAIADEARARDEHRRAVELVDRRRSEIDDRRHDVADARLDAAVPGLGLPFVVVNAYALAAKRLATEQPSCRIRWSTLAGIGRTESNHGTFGGATVDRDGNETKPIYGVPLDGTNGTASVGDTDGGAVDGDASTDRAAGPMQFIPASWKTYGRDANGDGHVDPQNYYDAAVAAANLLCTAGDLSDDEGLRRAIRRYNDDSNYVETVLERAHDYDRYVFPPPAAAKDPALGLDGLTVPGA